jgi:hypothetical protein
MRAALRLISRKVQSHSLLELLLGIIKNFSGFKKHIFLLQKESESATNIYRLDQVVTLQCRPDPLRGLDRRFSHLFFSLNQIKTFFKYLRLSGGEGCPGDG